MAAPYPTPDPLFSSLDALVRDGTISPAQADQVYRRVRPQVGDPGTLPIDQPARGQLTLDRPRAAAAGGVLAAGVVLAGLVVIWSLSSAKGFDWKTFLPMVVLVVCLGGAAVVNDRLSTPGAGGVLTGVLAAVAAVAVGVTSESSWDATALVYLAGVLMVAGGVAGVWLLHQDLSAVAVFIGGLVLVTQAFSDVAGGDTGTGSGTVLMYGVVLVVYGVAAAAAGWAFSSRHLTAALGGILAVAAMTLVILALGTLAFAVSIGGPLSSGTGPQGFDHAKQDIWIALVLGLVVCVALAALFALTGYGRYAVVSFVGAVVLPALAVMLTEHQHPLRWAGAFSAVAGLGVAAAVLLLRRNGSTRREVGSPDGY